ncbi:MAG: GWxTD domain-containing protein [Candidatus Acidiferrales bacterium]
MAEHKGTPRLRILPAAVLVAVLLCSTAGQAATRLSPQHKKWLEEDVVYLISDDEKKNFRSLPSDADRDKFIDQFWLARDPTPGTPENEYKIEHYRRIEYSNQYFSEGLGENGWRTDRGRIYIQLGRPAQVTKYPWQGQVRPMEIWFYANVHPSLPNFFNVVFFQPDNASDYRLYSPVMDGPTKLAVGSGTENNPRGAFEQLRGVSAEVARVSLTLLTDEPIDTTNFTATMSSDAMLTRIFNIPNDRFTKEMLRRRMELKEIVKTRVSFEPQAMQVHWTPLRQPDGDTAVHLLLLLPVTLEEVATSSKEKEYVNCRLSVLVRNQQGEQLFQQSHDGSYSYSLEDFQRLKRLPFGFLDRLPLPPGDYDVDFVFTNETTRDYYLARQQFSVPAATAKLNLSPVVVYSEALQASGTQGLMPFEFFNLRFVPTPRREFNRHEKLKVFFQIYLPPGGGTYGENDVLRLEYTIGTLSGGGSRLSESEEIKKQQFDAGGTVLHGRSLPLTDLEPGSYRLVVKVTDPQDNQTTSQTLSIKVAPLQAEEDPTTVANGRVPDDARGGYWELRRGLAEAGNNRPEKAIRHLQRALELNPKLEAARGKLAALFFAGGEFEKAATLAESARITSDTSIEAVKAYVLSLERTGRVDRAVELAEQAAAEVPASEGLYQDLGAFFERIGKPAKAEEFRALAQRTAGADRNKKTE